MRRIAMTLAATLLMSCGGGGGGGSSSSSSAAAIDCSESAQRNWVRSFVDQHYLFYADSPAISPASYSGSVEDYFLDITRRGVPAKDQFSFVMSVAEADGFLQTGTSAGIGTELFRDAQGRLRVGFVEPGSPAQVAGVKRGDQIHTINGTAVGSSMTDAQRNLIYSSAPGTAVTLELSYPPAGAAQWTVNLQAAVVQRAPVPLVTVLNPGNTGYLVFNEHLFSAQGALVNAFQTLRNANVSDLVLDLRYNGGGSLALASQAAHMISGKPSTAVFERLVHNDKQTALNFDLTFINCQLNSNFQCAGALPALNLNRVFVLATDDTCSASESIINGLRGTDVQVIVIGGTTCGKPYGFYQTNRCEKAYFAIEFEGVNAKGQGGYVNGFAPDCTVEDDFENALGNTSEGMLAAALHYRNSGTCPMTGMGLAAKGMAGKGMAKTLKAGPPERPQRGTRVLPVQ